MLKTSSSWFDCGVTHQSRHTLSLREIRGCVVVPKCVWLVLPKPSNYDCRSEMRKRQRIIMSFAQETPSLLTSWNSWKLSFLFLFFSSQVSKWPFGNYWTFIFVIKSHTICNAMTLAIWRSTWADEFSNMTIRTRFHPYCVINYTFESWVNNLINLYPQSAMPSSCVSHFPWNCYGPDN